MLNELALFNEETWLKATGKKDFERYDFYFYFNVDMVGQTKLKSNCEKHVNFAKWEFKPGHQIINC